MGGGGGERGGGTISDSILGGHKTLFLLSLYNFKNTRGGGNVPPVPPYSAVPELVSHSAAEQLHRY